MESRNERGLLFKHEKWTFSKTMFDKAGTISKTVFFVDALRQGLDVPFRNLRCSVTRLADLLQFGQLFKACGNTYFAQIAHTFRQFL